MCARAGCGRILGAWHEAGGAMSVKGALALGIDVGTSGVRVAALTAGGTVEARAGVAMEAPRFVGGVVRQSPAAWRAAIAAAVGRLGSELDLARVRCLAIDATAGTMLAADAAGQPVGDALMYNDSSGARFAAAIEAVAPAESAAIGPMSGLARALFLQFARHPARFLHQSDWLNGLLTGRFDLSDESHALKTGYDPIGRAWPAWVAETGLDVERLPRVVRCGEVLGLAEGDFAREIGLARDAKVVAGCADGCAAFLASGADRPGDAVSSLGSTLTVKILSHVPVFRPEMGIYSHRIGDMWLAGGASNAGGKAIADAMGEALLSRLDGEIDTSRDSGLAFYPMIGIGERFPESDPQRRAVMGQRPADDAIYLQGLYESLARIERRAYAALSEAGAPSPARIFALGGGTRSRAYRAIRKRILGVDLAEPLETGAAAGVARLALRHLADA